MADVAADLKTWSTTAASNSPADATTVGSGLADNLQEIQKVVRQDLAHKGADIASAGTTDLGAVAGFMHDITGTTTITSFGTVSAGIHKILQFDGALTITHNATSLICPDGVNITTRAGDVIKVMSLGSGNWIVTQGLPGMVLLETKTASVSAALDFTALNSSFFAKYVFSIESLLPATDASFLVARHSTDGGNNFLSTGIYESFTSWVNSSAPTTLAGSYVTAQTQMAIGANSGGSSNATAFSGRLELNSDSSNRAMWQLADTVGAAGGRRILSGHGNSSASGVNAIRFLMNSGNITSGTIRMYGMRK